MWVSRALILYFKFWVEASKLMVLQWHYFFKQLFGQKTLFKHYVCAHFFENFFMRAVDIVVVTKCNFFSFFFFKFLIWSDLLYDCVLCTLFKFFIIHCHIKYTFQCIRLSTRIFRLDLVKQIKIRTN